LIPPPSREAGVCGEYESHVSHWWVREGVAGSIEASTQNAWSLGPTWSGWIVGDALDAVLWVGWLGETTRVVCKNCSLRTRPHARGPTWAVRNGGCKHVVQPSGRAVLNEERRGEW
jgi:hypothetical protein